MNLPPINDTWCLNLSNFKWTSLKSGPTGRQCHGMFAANNKLYVLGGRIAEIAPNGETSNACPSIEEFCSFDLETKTWSSVDIIGDDRPNDLSEYTVLPLYKNEGDDDPSSVIIWGGYREVTFVEQHGQDGNHRSLVEKYGEEEWRSYQLPYIARLLRFDVESETWIRLRPIKNVLPKAQSIACVDRIEDGAIHMLIAGGYGSNPEKDDECSEVSKEMTRAMVEADPMFPLLEGKEVNVNSFHTPVITNKVFEVRSQAIVGLLDCTQLLCDFLSLCLQVSISEAFGDKKLTDDWSWDLYNMPPEMKPTLRATIAVGSPTVGILLQLRTCSVRLILEVSSSNF